MSAIVDPNIIRSPRRRHFTRVDQRASADERLTDRALAFLVYLLSKPDDWETRVPDVGRRFKLGRDATYKGIDELIAAGYMVRTRQRQAGGKFGRMEYRVFECPEDLQLAQALEGANCPCPENPDLEAQLEGLSGDQGDCPCPENPDVVGDDRGARPYPGLPDTAKADVAALSMTNDLSNPPYPPSGTTEKAADQPLPERPRRKREGREPDPLGARMPVTWRPGRGPDLERQRLLEALAADDPPPIRSCASSSFPLADWRKALEKAAPSGSAEVEK